MAGVHGPLIIPSVPRCQSPGCRRGSEVAHEPFVCGRRTIVKGGGVSRPLALARPLALVSAPWPPSRCRVRTSATATTPHADHRNHRPRRDARRPAAAAARGPRRSSSTRWSCSAGTPRTWRRSTTQVVGNVYDCFTDGTFVEPARERRQLRLHAAGLRVQRAPPTRRRAAIARRSTAPPALRAAASTCPRARTPRYTTTCTRARSSTRSSRSAVCKPLSLGTGAVGTPSQPASVVLSAASFATADGGTRDLRRQLHRACAYRADADGTPGAITDARCSTTADGVEPVTIRSRRAVAPASYVIEVALLRADGTVLGADDLRRRDEPGRSRARPSASRSPSSTRL